MKFSKQWRRLFVRSTLVLEVTFQRPQINLKDHFMKLYLYNLSFLLIGLTPQKEQKDLLRFSLFRLGKNDNVEGVKKALTAHPGWLEDRSIKNLNYRDKAS